MKPILNSNYINVMGVNKIDIF